MSTRCVILAAGVGSRLQPLTNETPKCCLKIKNETTLIRRVVEQLIRFVNDLEITVCVGFRSEKILNELRDIDADISYCFNADYDNTNNMYSAWLALKDTEFQEDVVILNADCVYDDSIIQMLDNHTVSTIFYDSEKWDDESMKITMTPEGEITNISKAIDRSPRSFVSIDLYKIMSNDLKNYLLAMEHYIQNREYNLWNEVSIRRMITEQNVALVGANIKSAKWFEIDTLKDYENAKKIFN